MKKIALFFWVIGAATVLMLSCKSSSRSIGTSAPGQLDGTWELNYITGPRIAFEGLYPKKKPFLTIETAKSHTNGNSGCNNFMGPIFIHDDSLRFGNMASTMMACAEGQLGENVFLKTLPMVKTYRLAGDTLWLRGTLNVDVMRFVRKVVQ